MLIHFLQSFFYSNFCSNAGKLQQNFHTQTRIYQKFVKFSHDFINKTPHVISTLLKYKTENPNKWHESLYSKWKCYLSIKMRNNKNINSNLNFFYIKYVKKILSFIYIDFRLKSSKISSVDFPFTLDFRQDLWSKRF